MPRVLLIAPTSSYRTRDFVEAAESLGVEVAVATDEQSVFEDAVNDRYVQIDCSDPTVAAEAVADLASRTPIDAIVSVDDAGVETAAIAAEKLGLPHNSPFSVGATRNKIAMRRAFERGEVPQPSFRAVGATDDAGRIASEVGFPVVLKPLSLSGSRGVIRADDEDSARAADQRIRNILAVAGQSPNEPLIVEQFMPGPEVSLEGILYGGELDVLAIFDKPDPMDGPVFEETIFVTPSRLHPEVVTELERVAELACGALDLREGPVHVEMRITNGQVRVVEVGARTIGGLCGRALRFGLLRTPLEALVLRHALGQRRESLRREHRSTGVQMLPIPKAGVLKGVEGIGEAAEVPGIAEIEIVIPDGEFVRPLPEGDRYLGFVFANGNEPHEVEKSLRTASSKLRIAIA